MLLLLAWTSIGASPEDDEAQIRQLREQSNQSIARHDLVGMGEPLDEDFVATISSGDIDRSREAHLESFARHFEAYPDVVYVRTPERIVVSQSAPAAMEYGQWQGRRSVEQGVRLNGGEYSATWRKSAAGWRIRSELYVALHCEGPGCTDPAREGWQRIEQGALLIDVRSAEEYAGGHLEGAINIPHTNTDALAEAIGTDPGRDVVLYCGSGRRVGIAIEALEARGYQNLHNATGLNAMQAAQPGNAAAEQPD